MGESIAHGFGAILTAVGLMMIKDDAQAGYAIFAMGVYWLAFRERE